MALNQTLFLPRRVTEGDLTRGTEFRRCPRNSNFKNKKPAPPLPMYCLASQFVISRSMTCDLLKGCKALKLNAQPGGNYGEEKASLKLNYKWVA